VQVAVNSIHKQHIMSFNWDSLSQTPEGGVLSDQTFSDFSMIDDFLASDQLPELLQDNYTGLTQPQINSSAWPWSDITNQPVKQAPPDQEMAVSPLTICQPTEKCEEQIIQRTEKLEIQVEQVEEKLNSLQSE
jgi:hypothetical protein